MKFLVKHESEWVGTKRFPDGTEVMYDHSIPKPTFIQASNIDTALTLARLQYGKHIIVTTI